MRRLAITLYLVLLFAPAVVIAAAAISPDNHMLATARDVATMAAVCIAIGSAVAACALAVVVLRRRKPPVLPAR